MSGFREFCIALPEWVTRFVGPASSLDGDEAGMRLAIGLSAENVRQGTGGPFGAVVVDPAQGELVAAGVNIVIEAGLSVAHAEIIALSLAQRAEGDWNLAVRRPLVLYTSCEPCAMCFGALPWAGIRALVCGARREDAEAAGFDEGDKPGHWVAALEARGITVSHDVLRPQAAAVLREYRAAGGEIYNAAPEPD